MTAFATDPRGTPSPVLLSFVGFLDFLRRRGLRIGVGAEVDLGRALNVVSILDRVGFHHACQATLAKSPGDLAILNAAFAEYWSERPLGGVPERASPGAPASTRRPSERQAMTFESPRPPSLASGPSITVRFGIYSPEAPPTGHPLRALAPRQVSALRAGARRFRRSVATLPGRRYEPSRHGQVDIRRTARRALRSAGEWTDLARVRKKSLRTELIVFWDVSGSMREHDDRLAALAYAVSRVVRRSRVFAFSTDLREVTDLLAANPYRRAIAAVASGLGPAGGGTRLGHCLVEFRHRHGDLVRRRTTVLVLSDGWDLGESEIVAREVRWLRRRSHLVAWVTPYARDKGFHPATAALQAALPHIDMLLAPSDFEEPRPFHLERRAS